jgi:hypothetical protein
MGIASAPPILMIVARGADKKDRAAAHDQNG